MTYLEELTEFLNRMQPFISEYKTKQMHQRYFETGECDVNYRIFSYTTLYCDTGAVLDMLYEEAFKQFFYVERLVRRSGIIIPDGWYRHNGYYVSNEARQITIPKTMLRTMKKKYPNIEMYSPWEHIVMCNSEWSNELIIYPGVL